MYKIEKNIPFEGVPKGDKIKLVSQMEVGDSFLISEENITEARKQASSFITAGRRLNIKLASKTTEDGLRVWRLS